MKTTIINKILLVLMLITAQQVSALEFQVDGIYYRTSIFTKNTAYVTHSGTSYTESVEYQGEVVIPESVTYNGKTYTIASIGGYAFAACPGLTSVTIPNTVTTINQNAFNGCTGLKTIECKATTPPALGDNAFTSYDATLVVPSSSESAYKSAAGWSNFKFKEESSETPGSGENSGEDNTGGGSDSGEDSGSDNSGSDNTYGLACKILNSTDVAIIAGTEKYTGDIVIPSQVTISGKTYTVTSIADDAFKGCTGLTSITIPSSITSIGSSSFDSCNNLNKVNISDILSWCKITFGNSLANPLYYAKKLYLNGTLVTKLEIPSAITEIKNYTFYNCTSISTIVFPSGILKIGNSAFVNCSNLTSVTIPNSVTTIDENAFNGCIGLTSLTIGSSVGSIGNYAFGNCTGLKSVTSLNSTPPTCGTGVFQGVTISSIPLTVPAGSESLYKATYTWQDFKYKEESENPGDDPAVDTSGLKYNIISSTDVEVVAGTEKYTGDIVIPSQTAIDGKVYNVTKVGNKAFYNCTGLTSVTIPNSVTSIGNYAFYYCRGLTSITIPNSVTNIGEHAFSGCRGLTSVTIPNSVTSIGKYAFQVCTGLTSVTIPNSVTSIGEAAFSNCSGLTSIVVESGNTVYDSRNNCNAIIETSTSTLITGCKNTVIPSSVTTIGTASFYGCTGLTSITIPSSVVSLGEGAFFECTGLTSISIPNSVTSIGENVFAYCENLKTATLSNKIKTISFSAFSGCYSLTGIEIPNSVTTIDEEAFSYCESITNITIGENVNSIGKCAFMSCNGLSRISTLNPTPPTCGENVFKNVNVSNVTLTVPTGSVSKYKSADTWKDFKYEQTDEDPSEPELPTDNSGLSYNILNSTEVEVIAGAEKYTGDIVIPSQTTIDGKVYNVTKVGNKAFYECTGLTSVTIPEGVTSIGSYAFYYCSELKSITIPNSVKSIGSGAFSGCIDLESIIVESGNIVYDSRDNCNAIIETSTNTLITGCKNTVIPDSITSIGDNAFFCCYGLTSITIPEGVTSIGRSAFNYCSKLTSITIPNSVTSIGDLAFYDCSVLTSITIPNSVTSIGGSAFSNCSGLTSITIPNSVTIIGLRAFNDCSGLTSVIIGNSVTSIGDYAFSGCNRLTSVTSLNPTPPMCGGTDVFGYVSVENITLEVPSVSVSLYQSADIWKRFGTIKGIVVEESGGSDNEEIISGYKITKQWTVPVDATTGLCSSRTGNGYGDTFYGANNTAGTIEEWKDGQLVASYDVNKFCADNQLGETIKVKDEATGAEVEKFANYVLWTAVMVDDAGNVLANVGTGAGSAVTCQNWVLLPASNRNAMQLLHIDEFPSADVTLGRVDVPSRIVGNITDGVAYLYIPALGSALMPVMYIALDGNGKIYYDAENSWILMSSVTFDSTTNVATFQTADEILNAADEAGVAAKTYVRSRGQGAPFTWNAETSQFEKNTAIPQGNASTPGMGIFEINEVQYIVVPVKSATNGTRGSSVAVYNLADGTEVASWDSLGAVDYYVGSVTARANEDGTAYIYVAGHKDCFGILKFEPESVSATSEKESMSFGHASSALDEIVTEENAAVEYYNLQGVRVMNPEKGIYIKRQGGKTSKVVL